MKNTNKFPLAVYLHWPFCAKRCSYCAFNTYVKKDVEEERMKNCLKRSVTNQMNHVLEGKTLSAIQVKRCSNKENSFSILSYL